MNKKRVGQIATMNLIHLDPGVWPIDKPYGVSSFFLVKKLRKLTGIKKIGHTGTLDPLASGVMVMLVGKEYTQRAAEFINDDKEYIATICLGFSTTTYDLEGASSAGSSIIPTIEELHTALTYFQGHVEQIPPMFSAKKVNGKKLYHLARRGIKLDLKPIQVMLTTHLLSYHYPFVKLHIQCNKGTYIRSLADALGKQLKTGGHLVALKRVRVGRFRLSECLKL